MISKEQARIIMFLKGAEKINRHTHYIAGKIGKSVTHTTNQLKILESKGLLESHKSMKIYYNPTAEAQGLAHEVLSVEVLLEDKKVDGGKNAKQKGLS